MSVALAAGDAINVLTEHHRRKILASERHRLRELRRLLDVDERDAVGVGTVGRQESSEGFAGAVLAGQQDAALERQAVVGKLTVALQRREQVRHDGALDVLGIHKLIGMHAAHVEEARARHRIGTAVRLGEAHLERLATIDAARLDFDTPR